VIFNQLLGAAFLFTISVSAIALEDEGLPPDVLDAMDNFPSECVPVGNVLLPNGKTIEEFEKNDPCDEKCRLQRAQSKMQEERLKLAKAPAEVGGKLITDDRNPEKNRRVINGPANLRDAPSGKIIGSFPDGFVVLIVGQKDDWYRIRGYWDRVCETGWTHKKNLIFRTRKQLSEKAPPNDIKKTR
jgi:hypothetical protein